MHFSPRGLQQVPMDAQWMLKGCSMVAYPNLNTLSTFSNANQTAFANDPSKFSAKIQLFFDICKFPGIFFTFLFINFRSLNRIDLSAFSDQELPVSDDLLCRRCRNNVLVYRILSLRIVEGAKYIVSPTRIA